MPLSSVQRVVHNYAPTELTIRERFLYCAYIASARIRITQ